MGNYLDTSSYAFNNYEVLTDPFAESELPKRLAFYDRISKAEVIEETGESLTFLIFTYKECMSYKNNEITRWAFAKLELTDKLIRRNQPGMNKLQQNLCLEPATINVIDKEMEDVFIESQLRSLKNYRTKLVELINQMSSEKNSPKIQIQPKLSKCKNENNSKNESNHKRRKLSHDNKENLDHCNVKTLTGDAEMTNSKISTNSVKDNKVGRSVLKPINL